MGTGDLLINHEAMASCSSSLSGSAETLNGVHGNIQSAKEALGDNWQGIAGSAFNELVAGTLNIMQGCNQELVDIAATLVFTNETLEVVDHGLGSGYSGGE